MRTTCGATRSTSSRPEGCATGARISSRSRSRPASRQRIAALCSLFLLASLSVGARQICRRGPRRTSSTPRNLQEVSAPSRLPKQSTSPGRSAPPGARIRAPAARASRRWTQPRRGQPAAGNWNCAQATSWPASAQEAARASLKLSDSQHSVRRLGRRRRERDRDHLALVRVAASARAARPLQRLPVHGELPGDRQPAEIDEIVAVGDLDLPGGQVHRPDAHRLQHLLVLPQAGMRRAVGGDQAVDAESCRRSARRRNRRRRRTTPPVGACAGGCPGPPSPR